MIQETFLKVWIYCVEVCVCNEVIMTRVVYIILIVD